MQWDITNISECASTNSELKKLCEQKKATAGTVITTDLQTTGRGRFERTWVSPSGNIAMSLLLNTPEQPEFAYQLNLVAALAITNTIYEITPAHPWIKWPNDVLINNKKVCGILSECYNDQLCIIGIGFNLNSTVSDFPTDLQSELTTLRDYVQDYISKELFYQSFFKHLGLLLNDYTTHGFAFIRDRIHPHLAWLGKDVTVTEDDTPYPAKILNISELGFLQIATSSGAIKEVMAADVRLA